MWKISIFLPFLVAARFPGPPVFTSVQHYPPICYLPPGLLIAEQWNRAIVCEIMPCSVCFSMTMIWRTRTATGNGCFSDSGLCSSSTDSTVDLFTRYYFDSTTQECYPFGVQACGGNENRFYLFSCFNASIFRFKSKVDCENYCQMSLKSSSIC